MLRIHLTRIVIITIVWTLLGLFLTIYDQLLLDSHLSGGHHQDYTFGEALAFNVLAGFFGGMMGGITLIIVNRKFRTRPIYEGLAVVVIFFVIITSTITLFSAIIPTLINYEQPLTNPEAKAFFLGQILTTLHLKNLIFWAIVVAITHFSIQVSNKFGPGNLWNILNGKYHLPKHENRVFMFIDLKSSTTIAEQLGGETYHQFLKDVFSDITEPIIKNQAEIYQYVGDEIVVSWNLDKVKNKNIYLNCFFDIQSELKSKESKYLNKYELTPEFKAGAHYGDVIAGEVGIIKRDITYSGDVLNTTARIQGQCNDLESLFLISNKLYQYIEPKSAAWTFHSKGQISLKGKEHNIELIAVVKV